MKLTSTKQAGKTGKVKILVYGKSGVGKTVLCSTAPKPIIISSEGGTLSLRKKDIPLIEVKTTSDVFEALRFVKGKKGKKYETVCLDSASDIAEIFLSEAKKTARDPRQAYGALADEMIPLLKSFRDLKRHHVCIVCKEAVNDEGDHYPYFPGQQLIQNIPYYFDEMLAMRVKNNDEEEEETVRFIQAEPDLYFDIKDRSGNLPPICKPDLTWIIKKCLK